MTFDPQTALAVAIVLGAAAWLLLRLLRRPGRGGPPGSCPGCGHGGKP